jgi:prolyl oligopeptidase
MRKRKHFLPSARDGLLKGFLLLRPLIIWERETMNRVGLLTSILPLVGATLLPSTLSADPAAHDPYLWLEEVSSERALSFVRGQNKNAENLLTGDARFQPMLSSLKEVLFASDRIPFVRTIDSDVYNFWQDKTHVRGILRRASQAQYNATQAQPNWETVLDVDQLAASEGRNWVYVGSDCNRNGRCLIRLSDGGTDAAVLREFDLKTKKFVNEGFVVPEGKTRACWFDDNTILIGLTGSVDGDTSSGYPRHIKLWKRGTPIQDAPVIFSGQKSDVSVSCFRVEVPEGKWVVLTRAIDFFNSEYQLLNSDGSIRPLNIPQASQVYTVYHGQLIVSIDKPAQIGGQNFRAGSVLAFPLENMNSPSVVFAPTGRTFLNSVQRLRSGLVIDLLDNVSSRLRLYRPSSTGWAATELPVPNFGSGSVTGADPFSDDFYYLYESFLVPPSLHFYAQQPKAKNRPQMSSIVIKRLSQKFESSNLVAEQFEAKSADGTLVPYFIVHRRDLARNGDNPTLMNGYGGFQVSLKPYYSSIEGKAWLEKGGVFVVANIRGGGEFGPEWHSAALKENRQRAFDDFIAVAEDLIARKITSPRRLGIRGGSNGGLLVGAVMVQRPELFNAVVCDVPLLDMFRYHKLLAGASWQGEYGNVEDDDAPARAIRSYSPYQNVKSSIKMPTVLFTTSTKDDRVHPGHARKMAARMLEQGHEVYLYENIEGGHGAAANLEQRAYMNALRYQFLMKQLMD